MAVKKATSSTSGSAMLTMERIFVRLANIRRLIYSFFARKVERKVEKTLPMCTAANGIILLMFLTPLCTCARWPTFPPLTQPFNERVAVVKGMMTGLAWHLSHAPTSRLCEVRFLDKTK